MSQPGNQMFPVLGGCLRGSVVPVAGAGGANMSYYSSSSFARFPPEILGLRPFGPWPIWALAHLGPGPYGPWPIWALGPFWAQNGTENWRYSNNWFANYF